MNLATDFHEKVRRAVALAAQRIQNVTRRDDEENFDEDENDGDEEGGENDVSMDEDDDEVEGRDFVDMNPANLFDQVSLCITKFYLKSLLIFLKVC